jgi:hypothetical protein
MRVFIAGIIQGSRPDMDVHDQGYRSFVSGVLREVDPDVEIIDPHTSHPERFGLTEDEQRAMFVGYADIASEADLLIAYLPEASMGTAVEMWAGYQAGVPVWTVTTLTGNWVIFSLSTRIFTSLEELAAQLRSAGSVRNAVSGSLSEHRPGCT